MVLRVGTSGFSYREWKGSFYPEDLKPSEMLHYFGQQLSAVEINNTFYRMPKRELLAAWAEQVPEDFRFVLKAPRRITHDKRLRDAADHVRYLVDSSAVLGGKLGAFLFQLPPYLHADVDRLRAFLAELPSGCRAAFEFRHSSWLDDRIYEALRERGAALCLADTDEGEPPLVATADWGYLRMRRGHYSDAALSRWTQRVQAQPWTEAYVFFKHEDAGAAPRLARRLAKKLSSHPPRPSAPNAPALR